jgi:hypothetical protein
MEKIEKRNLKLAPHFFPLPDPWKREWNLSKNNPLVKTKFYQKFPGLLP